VKDYIFLLSVKQLKEWVFDNRHILGAEYYIAQPTKWAVQMSTYKKSTLNHDDDWYYWLNTPSDLFDGVRTTGLVGYVDDAIAYDSAAGVRPAFQLNISSCSFKPNGDGTKGRPYQIEKKEYKLNISNTKISIRILEYY
jgi:hypothetical protein